MDEELENGLEIAVIGMDGRFPGADTIDEFWSNLMNGVESISQFSDEELLNEGIPEDEIKNHNYVKSKPYLKNIYDFDADLFGYKEWEVENMDPQIRVFHECVYHALENAGYNTDSYKGRIGLYSGASVNMEWLRESLMANEVNDMDMLETGVVAYKDFLSQLISYKLNLTGPSLTVYTACSTSLVAIHLACEGLLLGDCNIAVAGGVTIIQPSKTGYMYEEGRIDSKSGKCRPFDYDADGTVFGDGAGAIVLKRLEDAVEDGDNILAVIKASSCNNDGRRKVGFAAPSIEGEKEVIETVYEMSEVSPESVGYIEAHGTGTNVGDPIEIKALNKIFNKNKSCVIGAVKANVGHLHAAAGVAGVIKTVLSINKGIIPPQINYNKLNSKINDKDNTFVISTEPIDWKKKDKVLRAGISSFGVGGTNVHMLLQEPPSYYMLNDKCEHKFKEKLLLMSAKDSFTLDKISKNLSEYFKEAKDIEMADAAFTLQMGRRHYNYRKICIASNFNDAAESLENNNCSNVFTMHQQYSKRPVAFMFPGQGAEYVGMLSDLYDTVPFIKERTDYMEAIVSDKMGIDIRKFLLRSYGLKEDEISLIHNTSICQPVLFITEYVISEYLMLLGINPKVMIGHSLGEYVAATLAGVFTLEDALSTIVERGRLMESTSNGKMLAVGLSEAEIHDYLSETISLAAVNSEKLCVISGTVEEIESVQNKLDRLNIYNKLLATNHAFHSTMMDEIFDSFYKHLCSIKLSKPKMEFISSKTGMVIQEDEACSPKYWVEQLRNTVKFYDAIKMISKDESMVFLESGPGKALSNNIKHSFGDSIKTIQIMSGYKDKKSNSYIFLEGLGKLWMSGVEVNWEQLYKGEIRRRIPLPLYPFNRRTYKRKVKQKAINKIYKSNDCKLALYTDIWKQSIIPFFKDKQNKTWVVFDDNREVIDCCVNTLRSMDQKVLVIKPGQTYKKLENNTWILNLHNRNDITRLISELKDDGITIDRYIYGCLTESFDYAEEIDESYHYENLLRIVHEFYNAGILKENTEVYILSSIAFDISSNDNVNISNRALMGLCSTLQQEYPGIRCRMIDIDSKMSDSFIKRLTECEFLSMSDNLVSAYRSGKRYVLNYEKIDEENLKTEMIDFSDKVFVVINGTKQYETFLKKNNVIYKSGYSYDEIRSSIEEVNKKYGRIDGIFYYLNIKDNYIRKIEDLINNKLEISAVNGLLNLNKAISGLNVGFCWVESSISALLGGIGFAEVSVTANIIASLVEKFNKYDSECKANWINIYWDFINNNEIKNGNEEINNIYKKIYLLIGRVNNVAVSLRDLELKMNCYSTLKKDEKEDDFRTKDRPKLETQYKEPLSESEKILCEIVEELLSIKPVGIEDNFLDLGGDSLIIMRIVSRVKDVFRMDIPLKEIITNPTIKGFMNYILSQWTYSEAETIAMAYREYKKILNQ